MNVQFKPDIEKVALSQQETKKYKNKIIVDSLLSFFFTIMAIGLLSYVAEELGQSIFSSKTWDFLMDHSAAAFLLLCGMLLYAIVDLLVGIAKYKKTKRNLFKLQNSYLSVTDDTISGTTFSDEDAEPVEFSVALCDVIRVQEGSGALNVRIFTKNRDYSCYRLSNSKKIVLQMNEILKDKV